MLKSTKLTSHFWNVGISGLLARHDVADCSRYVYYQESTFALNAVHIGRSLTDTAAIIVMLRSTKPATFNESLILIFNPLFNHIYVTTNIF